ncbi:MAG: hypothetical protein JWQ70_367 [Aeromicrobium sp.]|nr:hypothetical protein [Aeromicrobium sp.]
MISAEDLADVFVEMADTLVADFGLVEFLYNLSERVAEICEALAVGILLADERGQLQYIAASTEQARLVELFQLQNSEGPCFDCFRERGPVVSTDLSSALQRWPEFAPRALAAGFSSVHAIPMRLREQVIGTVSILGSEIGRYEPADIRIVQALADVATIAIIQARNVERAETMSEQLQWALNSRVTIEQAKGALSGLRDVDIDHAFALMRDFARENRQRLGEVAQTVLTDPASIPALTRPAV